MLGLFKRNRNSSKKNVGLQLVIIMALLISIGFIDISTVAGSDMNAKDGDRGSCLKYVVGSKDYIDCMEKMSTLSKKHSKPGDDGDRIDGDGDKTLTCYLCEGKKAGDCNKVDPKTSRKHTCKFTDADPKVCYITSQAAGVIVKRFCQEKSHKSQLEPYGFQITICAEELCNDKETGNGNEKVKDKNGVGRLDSNIGLLISLCLFCGFSLWVSKISNSNVDGGIGHGPL